MGTTDFWRINRELETLAQLRHDLAGVMGRLVTKATALASHDPECAHYYEGEARYWDAQRQEALKFVDQMIDGATRGSLPAVHQMESGRTIQITNVAGDVIVSTVDNSDNVAIGKGINQNEKNDQGV